MVNGMVWVSSAAIFWLMAEHFHPTTKRILYYTFYRCFWYKSWGSKLVRKEVQGERAISNRNQGWTRFAEFGWDETVITNHIPVRAQPGDWRGRKTTHSGELWDRRRGAGGQGKQKGSFYGFKYFCSISVLKKIVRPPLSRWPGDMLPNVPCGKGGAEPPLSEDHHSRAAGKR